MDASDVSHFCEGSKDFVTQSKEIYLDWAPTPDHDLDPAGCDHDNNDLLLKAEKVDTEGDVEVEVGSEGDKGEVHEDAQIGSKR